MTFDVFQDDTRTTGDNDIDEYQARAMPLISGISTEVWYLALAINGEAGELAEHVKKIYRDENGVVSDKKKELIIKELGDVLWYMAVMADTLGVRLSEVARLNIEKLYDRKRRGVLKGSGDER